MNNRPTFGTYKGWSIKDNKWVYGSLVYDTKNPEELLIKKERES